MLNKCHIHIACTDTASWTDGVGPTGNTCEDYRTTFCRDNSVNPALAGAPFNFPEKNCCGCGKGSENPGILFKAKKYFH